MSFKREGDDKNLLGILRQRRIKDLLAVNIPEDEAFLTSNGRLSCTVCYHRPIFDTLEMLLVHRQGKKHAAGVEYQNKQKKELQQLILKRKHEQYIKDGTTNIKQSAVIPDDKKFCLGPAYDPRCKKNKVKRPKVKVDLNCQQTSPLVATAVDQLPGNSHGYNHNYNNNKHRKKPDNDSDNISKQSADQSKISENFLDISEDSTSTNNNSGVFKSSKNRQIESTYDRVLGKGMGGHTHQLKNLFVRPSDNPIHVTPYQSKKPRVKTDVFQSSIVYTASNSQSLSIMVNTDESCDKAPMNVVVNKEDMTRHPIENNVTSNQHVKYKGLNKKAKTNIPCKDVQTQRETAEKYLHYRGAGWKKDLFGNWIRDEDAEFDSDEEPPDLP